MICPKCGGTIRQTQPCDRCRITYEEMISGIRHDDMRKLFKKMIELEVSHRSTDIEESILAADLAGSSLLIGARVVDDKLQVLSLRDSKKREYILLFTDKNEYDKNDTDIKPMTNPFSVILDLLKDTYEGFVINVDSEACIINRPFLERYFLEN